MDAKKYDSKIYCCSNSPRSEAKILGIVDIILSLIGLGFSIWLTDMVKNHPEYYRSVTENANSTLADFDFLRNMNEKSQEFFLSAALISTGWGMVLGGVLFYAAQKSRVGLLKIWFIVTSFCFFMYLFLGIIWIVKARWKISTSAIVVMTYLYTGYELWIVFCLIRQLQPICEYTSHEQGHVNDNNPALVIVSPTRTPEDPSSVFTITGKDGVCDTSNKARDEENGPDTLVLANGHGHDVTVVKPIHLVQEEKT